MKKLTYSKALKLVKQVRTQLHWTDKHDEVILLEHMETTHIQHTIVFLSKKQEEFSKYKVGDFEINSMTATEWVEIFRDELKFRNATQ